MAVSLRRGASSSFRASVSGMGWNSVAGSGHSISDINTDFASSFPPSAEFSVFGNEKLAMQNLNSRLASYLQKVLSLEAANLKLEQKIKEYYESRSPTSSKDLSKYYIIIEDFEKKIIAMVRDKHQVFTKLENANLTVSDFRMKYESEKNMRLSVEADLARLRMFHAETETATKDLHIQLSGLKEELLFVKKQHEEEMHMARTQQSGAVNVQLDCGPAVNLDSEMQGMREQYEALILKNHKQIEEWFQTKVRNLNSEVLQNKTEITSSQTAFGDLKKSYQMMEIEIEGIHTKIQILQTDLAQVGARYGEQLSQLQLNINRLQTELQQITTNIQQQATEYQLLLNIKMRLEMEIAEYRRLLGGEEYNIHEVDMSMVKTVTVVEEVKKEEEHHTHQIRTKIITEKLVDGVVVSCTTDEKMQDLEE